MSTSASGQVEARRSVAKRKSSARRRAGLCPAVEAVESRVLLAAIPSQPLVIAALGDSLTDEYAFYGAATANDVPAPTAGAPTLPPQIFLTGRDAARNWDMAIGALRSSQLNFGPYTTTSRGATRNQGFLENWALSGTTASGPNIGGSGTTFAEEYQGIPQEFSGGFNPTPGLVTQTSSNGIPITNVNVVVILIGGNDYVDALSTLSPQTATLGDANVFAQANANIESGIAGAVSAIETASPNTKIVIATTPDITAAPLIQDLAGSNIGILKAIVGFEINALNTDLTNTYKSDSNVGLVNTKALFDQFISNPVIDGVTVDMTAAGQDYTDGFIGDGFHPGSIVQGILAQAIVGEINTLYGSTVVTPITDADIVNYAEASQPTISFNSSTTSAAAGQDVALSAHVVQAVAGNPAPTGTVTFETLSTGSPQAPDQILGTVPVDASGGATLNIKSLPAGNYQIAAIYNGDQANDARLSTPLSLSVTNSTVATSTTVFSSANPANLGQPVTFTAVVTASESGVPTPSGTVAFVDQNTNQLIGTAPLNAQGMASFSVSNLKFGAHIIVAYYEGTSLLAASKSPPVVMSVTNFLEGATSTQVVPNYSIVRGRAFVTLQVIVSPLEPSQSAPTGSVQLSLGAFQVRTLTLSHGEASLTLPLGLVARRTVVAYYSGDRFFMASGSPFVTISRRPFQPSSVSAAAGHRSALRRG